MVISPHLASIHLEDQLIEFIVTSLTVLIFDLSIIPWQYTELCVKAESGILNW